MFSHNSILRSKIEKNLRELLFSFQNLGDTENE